MKVKKGAPPVESLDRKQKAASELMTPPGRWNGYKVGELKEELRRRRLVVGDKKTKVVKRLEFSHAANSAEPFSDDARETRKKEACLHANKTNITKSLHGNDKLC